MSLPKYKTLLDRLAKEIRLGHYQPGDQLPTHRQLAVQESIALTTASRVYKALEHMGLISCETGRGTFVRETQVSLSHGIEQQPIEEGIKDLNFNSPLLAHQPKMLRETLRKLSYSGDLNSLLSYHPHGGRRHEKSIIKDYLASHKFQTEEDNILIVSGAQQGLAIGVMALLKPGDLVAVDALTYPGFKLIAELQGLELLAIPVTKTGPNLDFLDQACQARDIKAIYTMPTLHNPLGWVIDINQRHRLIRLARAHEFLIIEDAAYSFLVTDPPPALVTLAPDITIHVSGFSKNMATGLRMGYVISPSHYVPKLERCIRATSWNTPALITALACQWIADASIYQLEKEKRLDGSKRQKIVKKVFHQLAYQSHPNSYFVWLPLPEEVRTDQLIQSLLEQHISVSGAEPYSTSKHTPHAIRLALASIDLTQLESVLCIVRQVIELHAYGKRT